MQYISSSMTKWEYVLALWEKCKYIEACKLYIIYSFSDGLGIHSQMDWGLQQLIHNQQLTSLLGATYKYQLTT